MNDVELRKISPICISRKAPSFQQMAENFMCLFFRPKPKN